MKKDCKTHKGPHQFKVKSVCLLGGEPISAEIECACGKKRQTTSKKILKNFKNT